MARPAPRGLEEAVGAGVGGEAQNPALRLREKSKCRWADWPQIPQQVTCRPQLYFRTPATSRVREQVHRPEGPPE